MIKVKKWISYDDAEKYDESFGGLGGFFKKGMRWIDYIGRIKDDVKPYAEAIKISVIKRGSLLTGDDHQYSSIGVPLFDDNTVATFSYRAWGDLMAAIWSEEENKDYTYMDFYV